MVDIREKITLLIENINIKMKEIENLKKVFNSEIKTSEEKMKKIIEKMEESLTINFSRLSISEVRACVCVCVCVEVHNFV